MSHVLHHRDRDIYNGMRQPDMYKAVQQSLIQNDIWTSWTSWQTQTTKTVELRTLQDLWSRADKSTRGVNMSIRV